MNDRQEVELEHGENCQPETCGCYRRGLESCLMHRCAKHYTVPQQNKAEIRGSECGGCIAEERDNEIADMIAVVHEVSLVYDEITMGRISKPNTDHVAVLSEHEEVCHRHCADKEDLDEALKRISTFEETSKSDIALSNRWAERAIAAEEKLRAAEAESKALRQALEGSE